MFEKRKNRKLAKKLAEIGSHVESSFMVYVNNADPLTFSSKQDALDYIKSVREQTEVFKLQIFRCDIYSL